MKKKSLKDIKDSGWKVAKVDQDRVEARKTNENFVKTAMLIAEKIGGLTDATNDGIKKNTDNTQNVMKMMAQQNNLIGKLSETVSNMKPYDSWSFDVKRNENGFISKIFAKGV